MTLSSHPLEDIPILRWFTRPIERQPDFGLNDRDGGAQLMRGIGSELRLSTSDEL